MNLTRFHDLLSPDVRWWICKTIDVVLHDEELIDPVQHAYYLDIAKNDKQNMIPFLDAEIVLRCLEERIGEGKNYHASNLHELTALVNYIKEHLEEENSILTVAIKKWGGNDPMIHHQYEEYIEPRVFLSDPIKKGIRMKREA